LSFTARLAGAAAANLKRWELKCADALPAPDGLIA